MSDRIVLMNRGRILQEADPRTIYDRPASVFASDFLGEANHLDATVVDRVADVVTVLVGDLRVPATAVDADLASGDSAVLSIRPERIRIHLADALTGEDMLLGTLRRMVFLGHLVRWVVSVNGQGAPMTVEAARGRAEHWKVGQHVALSWDPSDALGLKVERAETEAT